MYKFKESVLGVEGFFCFLGISRLTMSTNSYYNIVFFLTALSVFQYILECIDIHNNIDIKLRYLFLAILMCLFCIVTFSVCSLVYIIVLAMSYAVYSKYKTSKSHIEE